MDYYSLSYGDVRIPFNKDIKKTQTNVCFVRVRLLWVVSSLSVSFSPGCSQHSLALQVQNRGLKHQSFHLTFCVGRLLEVLTCIKGNLFGNVVLLIAYFGYLWIGSNLDHQLKPNTPNTTQTNRIELSARRIQSLPYVIFRIVGLRHLNFEYVFVDLKVYKHIRYLPV